MFAVQQKYRDAGVNSAIGGRKTQEKLRLAVL
jgi:hypothetical protein